MEVRKPGESKPVKRDQLYEWLSTHYSSIETVVLEGDPADEIFEYLLRREKVMVVMGSYGRSSLSRLFRPSSAELITKTMTRPLFISHE